MERTDKPATSVAKPSEQASGDFHAHPRFIGGDDTGAQDMDEYGMQHGGPHGPARDEALKRITRSHPRRDIPRIESMDPLHAPAKE